MNTKPIKYAVELAAFGSFQKVAEKHKVSRSAVSRNIKRLEEELGCTLFVKLQDGIVPTCIGDVFLRYARQILNIEDDLLYSIGRNGVYQGNVNIGMGTNRAMMFLSDIMPDFVKAYPNISVHIHEMRTSEIVNALLSRQLDFAVVSKVIRTEGLVFEPLLEEDLVMVVPADDKYVKEHCYRKGNRSYVRLQDFKEKSFVAGHAGQKSMDIADSLFEVAGITPKIVLRTENCYARAKLAEKSNCYALIPHSYTHIGGSISEHYHIESDLTTTWSVGITYIDSDEMTKIAQTLKAFILAKMRKT